MTRELMTQEGATELAAELDEWWEKAGYTTARHWIEKAHPRRKANTRTSDQWVGEGIWVVRSNLIGGLPPAPGEGKR